MPVTALKPRNTVESLRDIIQDLLVPEIKAIKSDMKSMDMKIDLLHDQTMQAIKHLDEKFTASVDVRERLAVLEDRIKRN
jgi:hypothetical protein